MPGPRLVRGCLPHNPVNFQVEENADIGYPCLTPVFTPRLGLLFLTLHVKLLQKLLKTRTIYCAIP